jgi:hypothetical protein
MDTAASSIAKQLQIVSNFRRELDMMRRDFQF